MSTSMQIADLRAEIQALLASIDPNSIGAQVEVATKCERLWLELSYFYLSKAEACVDTTDAEQAASAKSASVLVELALKCDRQASEWAHQARQMAKLEKVDTLRRIEERLDRQDAAARKFDELHNERETERHARDRLNRAKDQHDGE
jgi:hypothetical protein